MPLNRSASPLRASLGILVVRVPLAILLLLALTLVGCSADGDEGSAPTPVTQRLEAEDATATGNCAAETRGILIQAGAIDCRLCWEDVDLAGVVSWSLRYGSLEGQGDRIDLAHQGRVVGSMTLRNTASWDPGFTQNAAVEASGGRGTLCIQSGRFEGAVARVDRIELSQEARCVQDCSDRSCGEDGCGGSCGTCEIGTSCDARGECVCVPDCEGRSCGDGGCGVSCGTCDAGEVCGSAGVCECEPNCDNRDCGSDDCGGSCGSCVAPALCTDAGECLCTPDCGTRECGMDPMCGTLECGRCEPEEGCAAGRCVENCQPACGDAVCGDDGCGGSCGSCGPDTECTQGRCLRIDGCDNGVRDNAEWDVDCGGACAPCPAGPCSGNDSEWIPAGYSCVWSDEFGGPLGGGQPRAAVDSTSWTFQNLNVNGEAQNYTNRQCTEAEHAGDWNYCVEDGALVLRARPDFLDCSDGADGDNQPDHPDCAWDWDQSRAGADYTSGRVISKHKVQYQYGYIEFRARMPHYNRAPQSGLWPAIWLLGANISEGPPPGDTAWPLCGEFDIMEWRSPGNHMGWNALWMGGDQSLNACSDFPEGGDPACGPCSGGSCRGVERNGERWRWRGWYNFPHRLFHTYGFLWTAQKMEVFIDGDKVGVFFLGPNESEFQQPMFLIMNLAIGGALGGAVEITDWSTTSLDVDYIRWYRR